MCQGLGHRSSFWLEFDSDVAQVRRFVLLENVNDRYSVAKDAASDHRRLGGLGCDFWFGMCLAAVNLGSDGTATHPTS